MEIPVILAPILGLFVGGIFVATVGYLHWHKGTKQNAINWIGERIFRNSFDSNTRAEGLFNVSTTFLLVVGGLVIVGSIFIFNNL